MPRKTTQADAKVALIQAMQIEGIDLEPTPDEVDFFLRSQADDECSTVAESAESLTRIEKAYEEFIAMNRNNRSNEFTTETAQEIQRKREEVLARLEERHKNADA